MNNTKDAAEGSAAPTGYTPGPWTVEWYEGDHGRGTVVCPQPNGRLPEPIASLYRARGKGNANAALIAAAPDMYAMCKHLLWLIEVELQADGGHICDDARKLIESIGV